MSHFHLQSVVEVCVCVCVTIGSIFGSVCQPSIQINLCEMQSTSPI